MKCKLTMPILILLVINIPSFGMDLNSGQLELELQSLKNSGINYINTYTTGDAPDDEFDIGLNEDGLIYEFDYKSPKKAFIYSMLIPGWGQKYSGSHTGKSLLFLATEVGLWMSYFNYRNKGNKKTEEYEIFAGEHWYEGDSETPHSYRGWRIKIDSNTTDDGDPVWDENFGHVLPDYKDQQYFEMIGKYDQFRAGWDDFWSDSAKYEKVDPDSALEFISPNRFAYNTMRDKANVLLGNANKMVIFTVVNHLLSAFDAALAAKRYNRNRSEELWLSFRVGMKKYSATEEIPIIKASLRF